MAVAIRTGDKTAQTAGVCGRDLEIELKSASAVLATRSIHHALSAIASGVILLSYRIHSDFLLFGRLAPGPSEPRTACWTFSSGREPSPRRQVRQVR
jgi:hypothetical protein